MRLARSAAGLVAPIAWITISACAHDGGPAGFLPADDVPPPSIGGADGGAGGSCVHLQCRRVDCGGAPRTSLHGVVVTGSADAPDPVYNAIVYIPNAPLAPLQEGARCDQCGETTSGAPVAVALTGPDGSFRLEDVPIGDDLPLVVQLGKWRRQVTIARVDACADNELPRELTRLPRNRREGDLPRIAIATGAVDPIECVLRKMGIDDSEFTLPDAGGHVHVYEQGGSHLGPLTPPGDALWEDLDTLKRYDMVLLPCEGSKNLKSPASTQNLIDYANFGGRVFTSHFGYVWIEGAQAPFPSTAEWDLDQPAADAPLAALIDQDFPKGDALARWLDAVGGSRLHGVVDLNNPRHDVAHPRNGAQPWLYAAQDQNTLLQFTFNTPLDKPPAARCGRVFFSDFHIAPSEASPAFRFPDECIPGPLSPSERVLEFMLLDLATCVQDDQEYPKPPPAR